MALIMSDVTAAVVSDVKAAINSDWRATIKSDVMGSTGLATEPKTVEVDSVLVEADIVSMIEDRRVDGQRPIEKLQKE
jgi:hypothetical protein